MTIDHATEELPTLGDYLVLEQLGVGGTGAVYRARHTGTGQCVALKVMAPHVAANPIALKRFEQEFRVASKLNHPNIVRVLDYCGEGRTPYLVMDYHEGESVGSKIDREGKMPEDEAIRIIVQIAHGLHKAHRQGLIHRDVKPDNILLTKEGQAKLTDLGLVKDSDAGENLTRTGRGLGTPDFMAPEQFRDAKNASIRCDVYALAATLYNMLTGSLPFDTPDPVKTMMLKLRNEFKPLRQCLPTLAERTEKAIRRGMSANPEERPASCRAFVEELIDKEGQLRAVAPLVPMWHAVFSDDNGNLQTLKGTVETIRQALKEGRLGDVQRVRGSKSASGPFELLSDHEEFRETIASLQAKEPAPQPEPEPSVAPPSQSEPAASVIPPLQPEPLPSVIPSPRLRRAPIASLTDLDAVADLESPRPPSKDKKLLSAPELPDRVAQADAITNEPPPSNPKSVHDAIWWQMGLLILVCVLVAIAAKTFLF